MDRSKRKQVTIIYRMLPQYRVDFFEQLRSMLDAEGVDLNLLYSKAISNVKKDEAHLPWGTIVPQMKLSISGKHLLYQRLPKSIYDSSLIILMQENKILSNYVVSFLARRRGIRVALWGHGINFQEQSAGLSNWWKKQYSSKVDWWFAYTDKVAQLVQSMPFPGDRITVVNNAIDTKSLIKALGEVSESQKQALREKLGLGPGPVGIYCGGMYPEKRLDFLFEACETVRREVPGFELILIGAGPDARIAEEFAATRPWVHYVGPMFGLERVTYFSLAEIFLMPGLVGLAVLDSFALGTPIVTTKYPFHSPEIDYVTDRQNGLISDDDVSAYARAVTGALTDPGLLPYLRDKAQQSAQTYTVEAMAAKFAAGVLQAIQAPSAG
ncbi:glycosyltransferase involved in cell wall biosynthesis [Silvibacterium bohemicum]|uniref:Glycosyltransferase involved in cell wall biosynthesis n=1 Tax=Silvibacterium bohemicum TaxID=1577686 RepID=A0A841JV30_9BACT|nr:glycosyltransferase family 4 protein [Silvibacterium bohemicum]MBB6145196.1 glycosyltransferase involved in cell wall biosynthesis [Silvibacterium bohemicum]